MKTAGVYFNYKKAAIIGLVLGLFLNLLMAGGEILFYLKFKWTATVDADNGSISYNEGSNASSFDVAVKLTNNKGSIGYTATSTTYKLIFKDKSENIVGEQTVVYNEPIGMFVKKLNVTFGEGGDYPAVTGKVAKVNAEIVDVTFENTAKHSGAESPIKFILSHWWYPLLTLISILAIMGVLLIMESDPPLILNVLEGVLIIVGCIAAVIGTIPIVYAFFM